jgi:hypothetical protein
MILESVIKRPRCNTSKRVNAVRRSANSSMFVPVVANGSGLSRVIAAFSALTLPRLAPVQAERSASS